MLAARGVVVLAMVPVLAGCGAGPPAAPPAGVDQQEIPTSQPDPADFVAGVDNAWFPLPAGRTWTYRGPTRRVSRTVSSRNRVIEGVTTTPVLTRSRDVRTGRLLATRTDWYAQDRAGNVWQFGGTGHGHPWFAGTAGALAGLVVSAEPRVGDGYIRRRVPGRPDEVVTVESVSDVELISGTPRRRLLAVVLRTGAATTEEFYQREVGLVRMASGPELVDLVPR